MADLWSKAFLSGDLVQAGEALRQALEGGGLIFARNAVQSPDAVPLTLREVVDDAAEHSPERQ